MISRNCWWMLAVTILLFSFFATAQAEDSSGIPRLEEQAPLAPGTEITKDNWQQYKDYMTLGQQWLFSGDYFWKIQPNQKMVVGATQDFHLPKQYMDDTEKYSSQVSLKELPDRGQTIVNYTAGIPFPHPSGPHAGNQILWNLWYRYVPFLVGSAPLNGTYQNQVDSNLSESSLDAFVEFARLGHLSDPKRPVYVKDPFDYGEYVEVVAPEQAKYSASLILFYLDPLKVQENWSFVPSLRRALRLSGSSRCSPSFGSDMTLEDQRYGYNGQSATFDVKVVGHKKILTFTTIDLSKIPVYSDTKGQKELFNLPTMGWPSPALGNWQLREVYIIELQKVPSQSEGYCFGLRRIYVDAQGYFPVGYDLYDMSMKPWKYNQIGYGRVPLPDSDGDYYVGAANGGFQLMFDLQNNHATYSINPNPLTNDQFAPEYRNINRYMTPAGLLDVMK